MGFAGLGFVERVMEDKPEARFPMTSPLPNNGGLKGVVKGNPLG